MIAGCQPEFTPNTIFDSDLRSQQIGRLREFGYEVDSCLVDRGETAKMTVEKALRSRHYDCIVIGAGLREPAELLLLFERIVNLVHQNAPKSRIAFNTSPADTAEAVQRWIGPSSATK